MDSTLTIIQAQEYIKSKEHLYKALMRNSWYLPSVKSSIITEEYLLGVRERKYWCPRYDELKQQPCPDPPCKDYLMEEVVRLSTERRLDIGVYENRLPDKAWLLQVLSVLDNQHKVFKKDYLPPIKVRKEEVVIDNADDFFTNLPKLAKKRDKKAHSRLTVYQMGRAEQQVKKLKEQKANLEKRIILHGEKINKMEKRETVKIDKGQLEQLQSKLKEYEKERKHLQSSKKPRGRNQPTTPMKD